MPTSVRLDRKTTGLVARLARQTGRTKSQVIRDAIAKLAEIENSSPAPRTAYELLKAYIGIANSGGARLSEHTGAKFRALLRKRARERQATMKGHG